MIEGSVFKNYLGLPGAGKTLSAIEEDILPAYLSKQKIYSNTFINLEGISYFEDINEILSVRNAVIFFDEIGQVLDPYAWKNISNEIRRFFQYHRKRSLIIISTTQDVSFIAKPSRVLISSWIFCENKSPSPLIQKIISFLGFSPEIKIAQQSLSTYELQKLQKGVGASPLVDKAEEDLEDGFDEDLDLSKLDVEIENPIEKKFYSQKMLLHKELDDFKIEFIHRFCPSCNSRQGDQILKDDTRKIANYCPKHKKYTLKKPEFCPSHPEVPLDLKESGIYDTNFELPIKEVDVEWRPYVPSPAGYLKIAYTGGLSKKMISSKPKALKPD